MSRRTNAALLSALLLVGLPGTAVAQDDASDSAPMWPAASKKGVRDVTAYSGGFLAVGSNDKGTQSKAWTSADGRSWDRQDGGDGFEGAAMLKVEAFGDGAVALGSEGRKLIGWHSPDGEDWSRYSISTAPKEMEYFPEAIVDGPAGLLAVASRVGQDLAGQRFFISSDGKEWTKVEASPETNGLFFALEATPDEYLAIARPAIEPGTDLLWRSTDGQTWETFDGPADGYIYDIAAAEDGTFVGAGALQESEETVRPAIWHANELGSWELVHTYPSAKQTEDRLYRVDVGGPGFVAAGIVSECPAQPTRSCPVAGILASADGREWQQLGVADGVPGPLSSTEVTSITADGDTTVLLAWHEGPPNELWALTSP